MIENLAEEPGGGIFSQRRATIIRSVFTGNLAWDDGGAVYARRGGVEVFDSVFSNNLVDGSGGAIGSTGDILVVRSHVDGNTTDGDGGAIYTDEDGDVTVIDSTVDGNTADGPGGAIYTLEGDVTIVNSTLNGNRADDRGGAISGEADVMVINSTIARNAAVAHVGGGIWARSDLFVTNSTISNNYAEGQEAASSPPGPSASVNSTVLDNVAPVAANVGAGRADGLRLGHRPRPRARRRPGTADRGELPRLAPVSFGYNFVSDTSCGLDGPGDVIGVDPMLAPLGPNGGLGETRLPCRGAPCSPHSRGRLRVPAVRLDLEGEQHLARFGIDPFAPITTDQRGVCRPQAWGATSVPSRSGCYQPPRCGRCPHRIQRKPAMGRLLTRAITPLTPPRGPGPPRARPGRPGTGIRWAAMVELGTAGSGGWARRSAPWRERPTSTHGGW